MTHQRVENDYNLRICDANWSYKHASESGLDTENECQSIAHTPQESLDALGIPSSILWMVLLSIRALTEFS